MKLASDRFSSSRVTKLMGAEKVVYDRFSYETADAIYDIDIPVKGGKWEFQKNCQPHPETPIHKAISRFYFRV